VLGDPRNYGKDPGIYLDTDQFTFHLSFLPSESITANMTGWGARTEQLIESRKLRGNWASNQPMKPRAPLRNRFTVFATIPCRGLSLSRVKIVHPVFNSARLIAQEGGFTLHSDPWRSLEDLVEVRFGKRCLDIEHLYRWSVPKIAKPNLLRELSGLGVSHRNMFPELDGIARSLWETEVLWNGVADGLTKACSAAARKSMRK
jgi:hypothetical protein